MTDLSKYPTLTEAKRTLISGVAYEDEPFVALAFDRELAELKADEWERAAKDADKALMRLFAAHLRREAARLRGGK